MGDGKELIVGVKKGIAFLAVMVFIVGFPDMVGAAGASLKLTPSNGSYTLNQIIPVKILLSSSQPVAGVKITLNLGEGVEYQSYSSTGTIFNTEVTAPRLSGSKHSLTLTQVRLDTGFTGTDGLITELKFKIKSGSMASLVIDQANSEVAAYADSRNVLQSVQNASYSLIGTTLGMVTPTPGAAASSPAPSSPSPTTPSTTSTSLPGIGQTIPGTSASAVATGTTSPLSTQSNLSTTASTSTTAAALATPLPQTVATGSGSQLHQYLSKPAVLAALAILLLIFPFLLYVLRRRRR